MLALARSLVLLPAKLLLQQGRRLLPQAQAQQQQQ
jgi:hypothetical protein